MEKCFNLKKQLLSFFLVFFLLLINASAETSQSNDITLYLNKTVSLSTGDQSQDIILSLDTTKPTTGDQSQDIILSLNTTSTTSGEQGNDIMITLSTSKSVADAGEQSQDIILGLETTETTSGEQSNDIIITLKYDQVPYPITTLSLAGTWFTAFTDFSLSCSDVWGDGCNTTYLKIINYNEACGSNYNQSTSGTLNCSSGLSCKKKLCFYSTNTLGNVESLKEITFTLVIYKTSVGSPTSWDFGSVGSASSVVRSGSPENWTWRQTDPLSGRAVPHGSVTDWSWVDE